MENKWWLYEKLILKIKKGKKFLLLLFIFFLFRKNILYVYLFTFLDSKRNKQKRIPFIIYYKLTELLLRYMDKNIVLIIEEKYKIKNLENEK